MQRTITTLLASCTVADARALCLAALGRVPTFQETLAPWECLALWTGLALRRHGILPRDGIAFVLPQLRNSLRQMLSTFRSDQDMDNVPFFQLVVADSRYVTWTGQNGFLDTTTLRPIPALPAVAIQTTAYNLTTLFRRYWQPDQESADVPT